LSHVCQLSYQSTIYSQFQAKSTFVVFVEKWPLPQFWHVKSTFSLVDAGQHHQALSAATLGALCYGGAGGFVALCAGGGGTLSLGG
jgi:hypothetical protein